MAAAWKPCQCVGGVVDVGVAGSAEHRVGAAGDRGGVALADPDPGVASSPPGPLPSPSRHVPLLLADAPRPPWYVPLQVRSHSGSLPLPHLCSSSLLDLCCSPDLLHFCASCPSLERQPPDANNSQFSLNTSGDQPQLQGTKSVALPCIRGYVLELDGSVA